MDSELSEMSNPALDAARAELKDIATNRQMTMSDLVSSIDLDRQQGNLSSALRLFVLNHYHSRAA